MTSQQPGQQLDINRVPSVFVLSQNGECVFASVVGENPVSIELQQADGKYEFSEALHQSLISSATRAGGFLISLKFKNDDNRNIAACFSLNVPYNRIMTYLEQIVPIYGINRRQ